MASRYYESASGVIHYDRRGLGDPVLLVHGIYPGASHAEFERMIPALQRSYTVYAVDLLGFGESDSPRITHSAELHHHLLRDFLTEEIGQATKIIASGIGCGIAVRLGVYDEHLVDKLVMISPVMRAEGIREEQTIGDRISQFFLGTLSAGAALYETVSSRPALAQFLRERYFNIKSVLPEKLDALVESANYPNAMLPYVSLLNGFFDVDAMRWLRYVRAPTLVIWGEGLGRPPIERVMAPAVWSRGKRLEVVERTTHWPHDERSAHTNELIETFLAEEPVPAT